MTLQEINLRNQKIGEERGYKKGVEVGKQEGIEFGKQEGIEVGKVEGRRELSLEICYKMLKQNATLNQISELTNLSLEEIEKIANKK